MNIRSTLPALLLGCCLAAAAASGQVGALPYRTIAELFARFASLPARDKLKLSVRLNGKDGRVVTNLQITIDAKSGPIPVVLGPAGELRAFPLDAALTEENPRVVSNQPKGSLALTAEVRVRPSSQLDESVAWYQDALIQGNVAAKVLGGAMASLTPSFKTLRFEFTNTPLPSAAIRGPRGESALPVDPKGVLLFHPEAHASPDARLVLSAAPAGIEFKE